MGMHLPTTQQGLLTILIQMEGEVAKKKKKEKKNLRPA